MILFDDLQAYRRYRFCSEYRIALRLWPTPASFGYGWYKVVGWYSRNPRNEHVPPFARVVYVEASNRMTASELGAAALDVLYQKEGQSVDFLNWFVEEVK